MVYQMYVLSVFTLAYLICRNEDFAVKGAAYVGKRPNWDAVSAVSGVERRVTVAQIVVSSPVWIPSVLLER